MGPDHTQRASRSLSPARPTTGRCLTAIGRMTRRAYTDDFFMSRGRICCSSLWVGVMLGRLRVDRDVAHRQFCALIQP